jgi:hypothetical protein
MLRAFVISNTPLRRRPKPDRVTVMGASQRRGRFYHASTYRLRRSERGCTVPFQQAFAQSPRLRSKRKQLRGRTGLRNVPETRKCNVVSEAPCRAPASTLIAANQATVYNNILRHHWPRPGSPVLDGAFVPHLPGVLLAQGTLRQEREKRIFTGHKMDEGLIGADPVVQNASAFGEYLAGIVAGRLARDPQPP